MNRASWTGEARQSADATGQLRAVVRGGYSEAHREAGALSDRLDELLARLEVLEELPPESIARPRDDGH